MKSNEQQNHIMCGNVRISLTPARGSKKELTAYEAKMLASIMQTPDQVVTHDQVMRDIYPDHRPELNILKVMFHKMRKKLQKLGVPEGCVQAVWGRGYIHLPKGEIPNRSTKAVERSHRLDLGEFNQRWMPVRKKALIAAVNAGQITREAVLEVYFMTPEELDNWLQDYS